MKLDALIEYVIRDYVKRTWPKLTDIINIRTYIAIDSFLDVDASYFQDHWNELGSRIDVAHASIDLGNRANVVPEINATIEDIDAMIVISGHKGAITAFAGNLKSYVRLTYGDDNNAFKGRYDKL